MTFVAVIKSFVLPPGIILLALFFCLYKLFRKRSIYIYLLLITTLFLYVLSIPIFSRYISSQIESENTFNTALIKNKNAKAIVVLGCNRYSNAPEFKGKDSVSACTLIRLRYAAKIHKVTNLPIVTSGGSVFDEISSESELMKEVLVNEFNVEVSWVETSSRNTTENAREVAKLLRRENIGKIILVTHAIHMFRAASAFSHYGMKIIQAPTYFYSIKDNKPFYFNFLPSIRALYISNMSLYEIMGYFWFKLTISDE